MLVSRRNRLNPIEETLPTFEIFIKTYGLYIGAAIYILCNNIIPFFFKRWLPSRIKAAQEEVIWRRKLYERTVAALEQSVANAAATKELLEVILGNQKSISSFLETAVGDMRAKTKTPARRKYSMKVRGKRNG